MSPIDFWMNFLKRSIRRSPPLPKLSSAKSRILLPANSCAISRGFMPAAYSTAITEPALTPASTSGRRPASSIAMRAPQWAKPRAPPPLRATPRL